MTYRIISCLALALIGFGCKSATAPAPPDQTPVVTDTHAPGEYGFSYNGTSVDRKNFYGTAGYGSASYQPNYGFSGYMLNVYLILKSPTQPIYTVLSIYVNMPKPMTGTFATTGPYINGTSIYFALDTAVYYANTAGKIVITKFDTITNVVSGTFSFDGIDGALTEHVAEGYFSQVPIYYGTFNQGLVTADIMNNFKSDSFNSAGGIPSPSLYTVDSGKTFSIVVHDDDSLRHLELRINLKNLQLGSVDLNQSSDSGVFAEYKSFGAITQIFSTANVGTGNITITKLDWKTHRLSATFHLSGDLIEITNGKIDNSIWCEL
ncbi:MAG: hypothetical protein ACHQM6_04685 [Candidatus Kapaibacterium sp.]